ncbi:ankyrin repeat domain-containing protein [Cardinium endosymbiont of Culicoides punctatus]|uniref:ankyrin repeat domain-containing protein n=1 Tax=Cardinium endosymbiont of Culicoides punctatus TaxID=2304601 RepID=UPI001058F326|nr:ankyrin repeat domain-containing protein [Cardinium endosymbiont of Culicoides punctatus]
MYTVILSITPYFNIFLLQKLITGTYATDLLLEHPVIKLESKNRYGRTPLGQAVHDGHVEIVALLLKHGANPEGITTTKWGEFLSKLGSQKHKKIKELLDKAKQENV